MATFAFVPLTNRLASCDIFHVEFVVIEITSITSTYLSIITNLYLRRHLYLHQYTPCIGVNLIQIHRRILFIRANACEVVAQLLRLPQYRQHAALQEEV